MFGTWDLVRPRFWYPMSSLEQSMMDLERMSDLMNHSRFPFDTNSEMLAVPSHLDDDEFFKDLPVLARNQRPTTQHREASTHSEKPDSRTREQKPKDHDNDPNKQSQMDKKKQMVNTDADKDSQLRRAFSSYTYSNSSIVDDKGRRVTSKRRRYEDSTGRLKAVHERQIEGKKLRTTWSRMGPDDEGKHEAMCSSGTPEEFEKLWHETPFGVAQKDTMAQQQLEQDPKKDGFKPLAKEAEATPMET
ncbi:hypothetical protein Plhal703r1_c11g0058201 [Plasmopara halstedii]